MITILSPLPYQVGQRNAQGNALITLTGLCALTTLSVEVRLTPVRGSQAQALSQTIPCAGGKFSADLLVKAGWYQLLVTGKEDQASVQAAVNRVGVGEVFIVAGHSVAQGDEAHTLGGALDERVITIPIALEGANAAYTSSGLASDLPTAFMPYSSGIHPGPFGSNTHFWAKFAEQVAIKLDVPVLLLNSAFGGTNLQMWALSSQGQQFDHPFVKSAKGFPYINLKNALTKYASLTGCRALLIDHGQNDTGEPDGAKLLGYYKIFVNQARIDAGAPGLPVVVNRQTPYRSATYIRVMQEQMIAQTANCFAGPDYDALMVDATDRYDTPPIHLNENGMVKAASAWASVVTESGFLSNAIAFQANPAPFLPVPPAPAIPAPTTAPAAVDELFSELKPVFSFNLNFLAGSLVMILLLGLAYVATQLFLTPSRA